MTLSPQAFFKALKQPFFWCFVFVTLFNLQGARPSLPVPGSRRVLSSSLRPAFVKHFFQVFQTFFSALIRIPEEVTAALAGDLIRLPHRLPFVKSFFQVFSNFSKLSRRRPLSFPCVYWPVLFPAARRSLILAKCRPVVNTLFSFFFLFF